MADALLGLVVKAIHCPSGDHAGLASGPGVPTSVRSAPVATSITRMSLKRMSSALGVGTVTKASWRPSGDQRGSITW
jgi:hypothetical protein